MFCSDQKARKPVSRIYIRERATIFTSNRSGSPQIYELNVNNKRIKRLTFEGTYNARGRYLPDGKNIVFVQKLYKTFGFETFRCEILNLREKSVLGQLFLSKSDSFINMCLQHQHFLSSYRPFFHHINRAYDEV